MKKTLLMLACASATAFCAAQTSQAVGSADPSLRIPTRPVQFSNSNAQRIGDPNSVQAIFPNSGWTNKAALPGGRWATGPVFVKPCLSNTDTGFVFLIGGYDASFANTTVNSRYNTVTGVWRTMAALPATRGQMSPVAVRGKIYVIGGYGATSFSPVTTNSIYDVATNTWTTGAPMPTATGDYAIGVYKDSLIYIVGGYSGSADINNVQIYNTFTNTWTAGTPKPGTAVAGCRGGITGNEMVFCGGYSQTLGSELADAYIGVINPAAPATITWSPLPAYPGGTVGRHASGVALESNGLVYFAGGDPTGQGIQVLSSCFAYNTISDAWDTGPSMPVAVSNICTLAGGVRTDSLFMITMGGYDGSVITSTHSWMGIGMSAVPAASSDVAICIGATTQLNAVNGLSYSWTPSGTLSNSSIANPIATPVNTTTYTVVMQRAWGCPVSDNVVVTVNSLPNVVANATSTTVCNGSPVTLSGSGATSYSWTSSVTDNVAFTPIATNSYTVTGTDGNGCSNTASVTVTVNSLPTVVANSTATSVCNGTPVTLSGSGATSYSWTSSVMDNVAFTPAATDTYTVTGTDANGCSNTDMITVTVNALPTVVANATATSVCDGTPVTLSGSGATSYSWTSSVMDNVAFTPTATDTYTVTGTDANGCSNTDMVTVTVNALPTVTVALGQDTACTSAGSITLNGESPAGGTWSGAGVSGNTFDPVAAGMGSIMIMYNYTDANGCSGMANDSIWVDICLTASNIDANSEVNVFPNPTSGAFTLTAAAGSTVEIMNELGQVVNAFTATSNSSEVNMSTMSEGIYFVRVTNGDVVTTQRVVKN
jgi:hypothetical protein